MRDNKGQFGKGNKGKPKGAKNKTTNIGKDTISNYLESGGYEDLVATIETLEDKDKVSALLKLIEFVVPKQKAVEHKGLDNALGSISVKFNTAGTKPITSENDFIDD